MSATVVESPEEVQNRTSAPQVKLPSRFGWGDAIIPGLCVAAVTGLLVYLNTATLRPIVAASVSNDRIVSQTLEHLKVSLMIAVIVLIVAISLGVMVTRPNLAWTSPAIIGFANAGQAIPNVGLIAIIGLYTVGLKAVVGTLALYAILPVLRNTIVGIQQVDPGVIDAARGVGMSNRDILFRVEMVLAIPVIAAGARTALVLAVATVPFGDYLGAGGLGDMIFTGIKLNRPITLMTGALMVAVLALMLDWAGSMVERMLTPRGLV